ncbi:predicted protein [Nematostella vectensis]|uniref:Protein FAM136A n=1 Tax=Nematostella vectensis TaxID=45351 RepID=A7SQ76_NEMVE|nr:protein FAM136A [Nematostella vectensis]EDO34117.1 predicted protein [Nematostella vectensis]|eukprot:XP_001626217.1 predicted protein [Nematostella vectensis]
MAAAAEARVKSELEKTLESLEQHQLRPIQHKSHLCAAKCCDNQSASKASVQQCMTRCFQPLQDIQKFMETELQRFQGRLSRCAQQCQDDIQDKVDTNTSQSDMNKYQEQLEKCVEKCCNDSIPVISTMHDKMKKIIRETDQKS